ncbi:hypothetical protein Agau_L300283 [Agrobacterium tumefaciens F2]|jgi:hypothetical protein|nr:hypothetical protein Agau_L300283 [Agrobacterium tumefaciens F2]
MSQRHTYSQYSAEEPILFGESGVLEVPNYPWKKHQTP